MKLFKIADSEKAVKIRVIISKGKFDTRILEHLGGAKCGDKIGGSSLDESLLKEMLDMDIDGYGKMFNVTSVGNTQEGELESPVPNADISLTNKQTNKQTGQPQRGKPLVNETEEKQRLTQGFGV